MTSARFIRQLYVTPLLVTLYTHRSDFKDEKIELTDDLLAQLDSKQKPIWRNALNLKNRIIRAVEEDIEGNKLPITLGEPTLCWFQRLPAESCSPWFRGANEKLMRVICMIETNPDVQIDIPNERFAPQAGGLWWYNHRLFHSFCNFGQFSAVYMAVEFNLGP